MAERPRPRSTRPLGPFHLLWHAIAVRLLGIWRTGHCGRLKGVWERPLRGSWADVYANVLFFLPWGFLLAIWMARRGAGFIVSVAIAMCTGAFLSCTVELLQLFAPSRSTSFVDLVTNSFGATVGALLGWPWARLVWPVASIRVRQLIGARPLLTCALLTCVVLLAQAFHRFISSPDAGP